MRLSKNSRVALATSVAAMALCGPHLALAQDAGDYFTTRLQRIVKGAGTEKVAVDTPQAVTVVDQEDIEQTQPVTVGDVFKQIPGANTAGSERVLGESFVIRGIGAGESQADEGRLILSVDGVDKNYQQYRMGALFTDPELYKRIEVLRGPASSTLYGSGALAGTVVFTTKDASDFLKEGETYALRLKSTYETNSDTLLGSVIAAFRPDENAELLIAANSRRGFDYVSGDNTTIDADFESFSGLAKGTIYFGPDNEQSLRASYQRWLSDAENQQYAQTVNSSGFGRVDRSVTDETYILAYENPDSDNDWIDFKAQVSYSDTLNKERNGTVFTIRGRPVQFFADADFRYETWQAKAENTVESRGQNWENFFTFGGQFMELNRQLGLRSTGAQPAGTDTKIGVFVQNEFIYDDKLTLIPGMRVDFRELTPDQTVIAGFGGNASTLNDVAYSPKLAALYKFNDNFSVFGSYAHTERLPTLDEVFDYRTSTHPGSQIDVEMSDNFEVGFSVSAFDVLDDNDAFQLKTTAFHNTISDFIYRNPLASSRSPSSQTAYINIGDVRLIGIEVEAAYESDDWFASAGASIIRGEDIGNNISASGNLNTVPPDELFVKLGQNIADTGISYGWKGRFVSAQDEILATGGRATSNGFATHELFFDWKPEEGAFQDMEFRASVENLLDQEYREFLSNDPGKGRTFKFSLVRRFGG